jgi:hypothetical protein
MSTRINVTVGDGDLLDRNAQQTAANRQARVLADQRATAEAEGVERRAERRRAEGRDVATGELLPSRGSQGRFGSDIQRLDEEPAANRRGGLGIAACSIRFTGLNGVERISIVPKFATEASTFEVSPRAEYTPVISKITGGRIGDFPWSGGNLSQDIFRQIGSFNILETVIRESLLSFSSNRTIVLFLPVGNQTGILLVGNYAARAETYRYVRQDEIRVSTPAPEPCSDGLCEQAEYTSEFQSANVNEYFTYDFKGYVVSNVKVREVTIPSKLLSTLEVVLPAPMPVATGVTIDTAQDKTEADPDGRTPLRDGIEYFDCCLIGEGEYVRPARNDAPITSYSYTVNSYNSQPSLDLFSARLQARYGIGYLSLGNNKAGISEDRIFSPAIYNLLNKEDPLAAALDPRNNDYQYYKLNNPVGSDKRFIDVRTQDLGQRQSAFSFYKANTRPTLVGQPVETSPLSRRFNFSSSGIDPNANEWGTILAWDGDDPGICRTRAESFGFSPSDLSP